MELSLLVRQLYDWNSFATTQFDFGDVTTSKIRPKWTNTVSALKSVVKDLSMELSKIQLVYNNKLVDVSLTAWNLEKDAKSSRVACRTLYPNKWKFVDSALVRAVPRPSSPLS